MILSAIAPFKKRLIALAAVLALAASAMAGWTVRGWQMGSQVSQFKVEAATTTAQRTGVALNASQAFRGAESVSFSQLAGAADVFHQSYAADVAATGIADAADAGLRDSIEDTVAASCGPGVPEGAAAERAREATRALGVALGECSQRRKEVAGQLAESLRRHQACAAEHAAAEALNVTNLNTEPNGAKEP